MDSSEKFAILDKDDFFWLHQKLFGPLRTKKEILSNLSLQDDMKRMIMHHIILAKKEKKWSVNIKVWPEDKKNAVGSWSKQLVSWLKKQWYVVSVHEWILEWEKLTPPYFSIRDMYIVVSWID